MTVKPSMRVRDAKAMAFPSPEKKALFEDWDSRRVKYFRMQSADVPSGGHRNKQLDELLIQAVREGWDYYMVQVPWLQLFKESAVVFEKRHHNLNYTVEDIVPIPGCSHGWTLIHFSLMDPGDEIVCMEPAHYMGVGNSHSRLYKFKVVEVPYVEEDNWEPDLEKLRMSITDKTKAIAIDHPNNPLGHLCSEKALRGMIDIAGEHDIPIISDELYGFFMYDGLKFQSLASLSDDVPVVTLTSFSKFFMKPGWRVGYMSFHDPENKITEWSSACKNLGGSYGFGSHCLPVPITVAAARALASCVRMPAQITNTLSIKGVMGESLEMVAKVQASRDFVVKRIQEIEGLSVVKPNATIYAFPRVDAIGEGKTWNTDAQFTMELLKEEKVGFESGSGYGSDGFGHFRALLFPSIEVLEEAYSRVERFLNRHGT